MSFLDKLFPTSNTAAPITNQPPAQLTQPAQAPTTLPAAEPTTPAQPLDPYKDLWQNDPNAAPAPAPMDFSVSPEALATMAGKLDFAALVPQTIHDRIAAGGSDAGAAANEMQNIIARAVFQHNALATTKLVEAATIKAQEGFESLIDKKLKLAGLAETTATSHPALSNPAVAPVVDVIQQRIIQKYPQASSSEIKEKLNEYLNLMGTAFNPTMASKANTPVQTLASNSTQKETDWAAYLFE
jgi:hypothetical protein